MRANAEKQENRITELESTASERMWRMEKKLDSDLLTRAEFGESRYEAGKRMDKLSAQLASLEETGTKDRAILLSRVSSLEPFIANLQTDVVSLRNSTVTETNFREAMDEVDGTYSQLESFVTKQQKLFEHQFESINDTITQHHEEAKSTWEGVNERLKDHLRRLDEHKEIVLQEQRAVDAAKSELKALVAATEKKFTDDLESTKKHLQALSEEQTRVVENAVEQVATTSDIRVSKAEGRLSMSESKFEVKIVNLQEKSRMVEDELMTVKGELAVANEMLLNSEKHRQSYEKTIDSQMDGLMEQVRSATHKLEKHAKSQRDVAKDFEHMREELLVETRESLDAFKSKVVRDTKEATSQRLREHEGELVDHIFHHFRVELGHASETLQKQFKELVGATVEGGSRNGGSNVDRLNELSTFCTSAVTDLAESLSRKITNVKNSTELLYAVFSIDKNKLPAANRQLLTGAAGSKPATPTPSGASSKTAEGAEDPTDEDEMRRAYARYIKTLPWYPSSAAPAKTPANVKDQSVSPRGSPHRDPQVEGLNFPNSRFVSPPKPWEGSRREPSIRSPTLAINDARLREQLALAKDAIERNSPRVGAKTPPAMSVPRSVTSRTPVNDGSVASTPVPAPSVNERSSSQPVVSVRGSDASVQNAPTTPSSSGERPSIASQILEELRARRQNEMVLS